MYCKQKADIFTEYFAKQCTINDNGSLLPGFTYQTDVLLSYVITRNYIIKIIDNFYANKAHGYDGISVSMLQLCAAEVAIPIQTIFSDCAKGPHPYPHDHG